MTAGEIVKAKIELEVLNWKAEALQTAFEQQRENYVSLFGTCHAWPDKWDRLALEHFEGVIEGIILTATEVANERQRLTQLLKGHELDG